MEPPDKERLIEAHQPHWSSTVVWLGFLTAFATGQLVLLRVLITGPVWLAAPLVLLVCHLMHAHLIAFHEAAHRTLCPSQFWNDAIGLLIGTLSFMGLTLYRVVHHSHHAYLGSRHDEELWPFVDPGIPRCWRWLAAVLELSLGLLYTPLLFLRSFLRSGSPVQGRSLRRRVWCEFATMAAIWGTVLAATSWWGGWKFLLVLYLLPAALAGNLQSLRKYIEHMGTTGPTTLGLTRSVVPRSTLGRFVAFSLFNVSFHGVHHKYAGMPQSNLPHFTGELSPRAPGEQPPYSSYCSAMRNMIRSLADPRVGAQWQEEGA